MISIRYFFRKLGYWCTFLVKMAKFHILTIITLWKIQQTTWHMIFSLPPYSINSLFTWMKQSLIYLKRILLLIWQNITLFTPSMEWSCILHYFSQSSDYCHQSQQSITKEELKQFIIFFTRSISITNVLTVYSILLFHIESIPSVLPHACCE